MHHLMHHGHIFSALSRRRWELQVLEELSGSGSTRGGIGQMMFQKNGPDCNIAYLFPSQMLPDLPLTVVLVFLFPQHSSLYICDSHFVLCTDNGLYFTLLLLFHWHKKGRRMPSNLGLAATDEVSN